jgi:hypothetical protein
VHVDVGVPDADTLRTDVRRGVARRRVRRTVAAVAAACAAILLVPLTVHLGSEGDRPPAPAPSVPDPARTTTPAAASGRVYDVVAAGGTVLRLTSRPGCHGCTSV